MSDPILRSALAAETPYDVERIFDEADETRARELLSYFQAEQGNAMYMWALREMSKRVCKDELRSDLALADARLSVRHADLQIAAERAIVAIGSNPDNEDAYAFLRGLLVEPDLVLDDAIERLARTNNHQRAVFRLQDMKAEYKERFPVIRVDRVETREQAAEILEKVRSYVTDGKQYHAERTYCAAFGSLSEAVRAVRLDPIPIPEGFAFASEKPAETGEPSWMAEVRARKQRGELTSAIKCAREHGLGLKEAMTLVEGLD